MPTQVTAQADQTYSLIREKDFRGISDVGTLIIIILVVIAFVYFSNSSKSNIVKQSTPQEFEPVVDESKLNDDLSSASDIDYRRLRNLLAVKRFDLANKETSIILSKLTYSYSEYHNSNFMARNDINLDILSNIPCTDLMTMDRLWIKYSEGRFGFSIQFEIWRRIYQQKLEERRNYCERERILQSEETLYAIAEVGSFITTREAFGWTPNEGYSGYPKYPPSTLPHGYYPGAYLNESVMGTLLVRVSKCW
jgi:hypothetical protein